MKINWKIRFKNKVWLLTFIGAIVAFAYQVCAMLGIVPKLAEDQVMDLVKILLTLLVGLGVIVDPTTAGTADSERALTYGTDEDVRKEEN